MNKFLLYFSIVVSSFCIASCVSSSCETSDMSFKNDIQPLFQSSGCLASGCHSQNDAFSLVAYDGVKLVVDANRLLGSIKREAGYSPMPKVGKKLTDCNISKVEAWITQGAKNN